MIPVRVSMHAAARYCERIDPRASLAEAIERIQESTPAVRRALAFGCRTVKRADGAKLILDGDGVVVTVYTRHMSLPPMGWAA